MTGNVPTIIQANKIQNLFRLSISAYMLNASHGTVAYLLHFHPQLVYVLTLVCYRLAFVDTVRIKELQDLLIKSNIYALH